MSSYQIFYSTIHRGCRISRSSRALTPTQTLRSRSRLLACPCPDPPSWPSVIYFIMPSCHTCYLCLTTIPLWHVDKLVVLLPTLNFKLQLNKLPSFLYLAPCDPITSLCVHHLFNLSNASKYDICSVFTNYSYKHVHFCFIPSLSAPICTLSPRPNLTNGMKIDTCIGVPFYDHIGNSHFYVKYSVNWCWMTPLDGFQASWLFLYLVKIFSSTYYCDNYISR